MLTNDEIDRVKNSPMPMASLNMYVPNKMKQHVNKVLDGLYNIPGIYSGESLRILDIGANLGSFSKWAFNAYPGSIITAYEPNPEMAILFRANCPAIELNEVAITTQDCVEIKLYRGKNNEGENSIFQSQETTEEFDVAKTLHPRNLPECDLMKIDAEGVEVEILEEYLKLYCPKGIALEVHEIENMNSVIRLLKDKYSIVKEDRWYITRSDQTWIRKDCRI